MKLKIHFVSTICCFLLCAPFSQAQDSCPDKRAPWINKTEVTYKIDPMPTSDLVNEAAIRSAIQRSFDRWGSVLGITFTRVNSNADINLGFFSREESPFSEEFDGNAWEHLGGSNTRGRAEVGGRIIAFDDDEVWKTQRLSNGFETVVADVFGGIAGAVNLDAVATHEIGHTLGLQHSPHSEDVMYGGGVEAYELSNTDMSRAIRVKENRTGWNCPGAWGVESFNWNKAPGLLRQVSIGDDEKVWGVNAEDAIYRWNGSGWDKINGRLKHISVGAGRSVWGVNAEDAIYRWNGSGWDKVNGWLKQISAGSDQSVWGVNAEDAIYRWNGSGWDNISGRLKQISVGSRKHIWGVNAEGVIYYRDVDENRWVSISGIRAKYVSVNDSGKVWAVDSNDKIYRRDDEGWIQVSGSLTQLSVGPDNEIWGVNSSDEIYTSNARRLK